MYLVNLSEKDYIRKKNKWSVSLIFVLFLFSGRRNGLMVGALDCVSYASWDHCCVLGQDTIIVPLSTQEYKWVPDFVCLTRVSLNSFATDKPVGCGPRIPDQIGI